MQENLSRRTNAILTAPGSCGICSIREAPRKTRLSYLTLAHLKSAPSFQREDFSHDYRNPSRRDYRSSLGRAFIQTASRTFSRLAKYRNRRSETLRPPREGRFAIHQNIRRKIR